MKREPKQIKPESKLFALKDIEALRKLRLPKGSWAGIYESPQPRWAQLPHRRPLCVGCSGASLARRLRRIERWVQCNLGPAWRLAWPLFAVVAKKRSELPVAMGLPAGDPYQRMKQLAYRAIAEARKRGDRQFLRELRKEAWSAGAWRGRKMSAASNQRMVRAILEGSKQVAAEEGSAGYEKMLRRLSIAKRRFCARVYEAAQAVCPGFSGDQAILGCLSQSDVRLWPGINFRGPNHRDALVTAYKVGARLPAKQRARLLERAVSARQGTPASHGFAQSDPTYPD